MIPIRDDNPTRITPYVTWGLVAAVLGVFVAQVALGPRGQWLVADFGAVPVLLLGGAQQAPPWVWATPFTALFLHGGLMHVAGNLLYLWIFGNNVEEAMGHGRFLAFYLVCGVLATAGHVLANPASRLPVIGASGAISGVLGAYVMLFPRARVLTLVPLGFFIQAFHVPAMVLLGFWIAIQVVSGLLTASDAAGVAWFAHVAGFAAGMALVVPFKRRGVRLFVR